MQISSDFWNAQKGLLLVGDDGAIRFTRTGRAKYVPLLAAFFVYILIGNLLGLIPGFSPPTSHSGVTFGLGFVSFLAYNYAGFREHGAKYGKQAMLDNIVNPSDAIGPEYVTTIVTLKSGDRVQGLITEESGDRVVVETAPDQAQRLKPSDIASRQQVRVSIMPEGLLNNLAPQQLADLLEFLGGLK